MRYQAKLVGEFTVTQQVNADSEEEARKAFEENRGDDIEVIATGDIEVTDFTELGE